MMILPAGLLLGVMLLVNSVPDKIADKKHGRKSCVVMLWENSRIAGFYAALEFSSFALISAGILFGRIPLQFASVLLTVPFVFVIYQGIRDYKDPRSFERCLAADFFGIMLFLLLLVGSFLVKAPL